MDLPTHKNHEIKCPTNKTYFKVLIILFLIHLFNLALKNDQTYWEKSEKSVLNKQGH